MTLNLTDHDPTPRERVAGLRRDEALYRADSTVNDLMGLVDELRGTAESLVTDLHRVLGHLRAVDLHISLSRGDVNGQS